MKTKLLIIVLIAIITVACGKREGVVPAKKKIDRVMAIENRYQDGEQIFAGTEYMEEQWTWDGKKVIRIDYRGENQYSENIYHDGRKIIRTTVPAYFVRSEFVYDGRKLNEIDVYMKERQVATLTFVHDDDGVREIVCRRNEPDSEMVWPMWAPMPLRVLVGSDVAQAIGRDAASQLSSERCLTKSESEIHYALTWDNDHESVVRISVSGSVEKTYTIELTYDDKENPYDQLFTNHEINDPIFGFKMLSEHNVTSIRRPYENMGEVEFKYTYSYDGDYPMSRVLRYQYVTQTVESDSSVVRVEKTEKYYYK